MRNYGYMISKRIQRKNGRRRTADHTLLYAGFQVKYGVQEVHRGEGDVR